jgi:hypothetical protein
MSMMAGFAGLAWIRSIFPGSVKGFAAAGQNMAIDAGDRPRPLRLVTAETAEMIRSFQARLVLMEQQVILELPVDLFR